MSNNSGHGEQKQLSLLLFPPLCFLKCLNAGTEEVVCIFDFLPPPFLLRSIIQLTERALILLRGGKMCHPARFELITLG